MPRTVEQKLFEAVSKGTGVRLDADEVRHFIESNASWSQFKRYLQKMYVLGPDMRSIGYTDQDPSRRSIGSHRILLDKSNPGYYAKVNVKETGGFNSRIYWEADPAIARFDFIVEPLMESHYAEWKLCQERLRFVTDHSFLPMVPDRLLIKTAGL